MNKILLIAQREFLITVSNKGFLFGLFILPLMLGMALFLGPRLLSASRSPQVVGRVAVIDPTGQVLPELRSTLSTSAIETRQEENARRTLADVPEANRAFAERGIRAAMGSVPDLQACRPRQLPPRLRRRTQWPRVAEPHGTTIAWRELSRSTFSP